MSSVVRQRLHRALVAQVLGERAGVDALDAGDVPFLEIVDRAIPSERQLLGDAAEFLDHKAAHVRAGFRRRAALMP